MTYVDPLASATAKIVDGRTGRVEHFVNGELVDVTYVRRSRVQPGWSSNAADEPVTIHHHSDVGLERMATAARRAIEDGHGDAARDLRVIVALQHVRARLRMRYGARDAYGPVGGQGTDVREHWEKDDEPPSYALAFSIDRERFDLGKSHVVAWSVVVQTGDNLG